MAKARRRSFVAEVVNLQPNQTKPNQTKPGTKKQYKPGASSGEYTREAACQTIGIGFGRRSFLVPDDGQMTFIFSKAKKERYAAAAN